MENDSRNSNSNSKHGCLDFHTTGGTHTHHQSRANMDVLTWFMSLPSGEERACAIATDDQIFIRVFLRLLADIKKQQHRSRTRQHEHLDSRQEHDWSAQHHYREHLLHLIEEESQRLQLPSSSTGRSSSMTTDNELDRIKRNVIESKRMASRAMFQRLNSISSTSSKNIDDNHVVLQRQVDVYVNETVAESFTLQIRNNPEEEERIRKQLEEFVSKLILVPRVNPTDDANVDTSQDEIVLTFDIGSLKNVKQWLLLANSLIAGYRGNDNRMDTFLSGDVTKWGDVDWPSWWCTPIESTTDEKNISMNEKKVEGSEHVGEKENQSVNEKQCTPEEVEEQPNNVDDVTRIAHEKYEVVLMLLAKLEMTIREAWRLHQEKAEGGEPSSFQVKKISLNDKSDAPIDGMPLIPDTLEVFLDSTATSDRAGKWIDPPNDVVIEVQCVQDTRNVAPANSAAKGMNPEDIDETVQVERDDRVPLHLALPRLFQTVKSSDQLTKEKRNKLTQWLMSLSTLDSHNTQLLCSGVWMTVNLLLQILNHSCDKRALEVATNDGTTNSDVEDMLSKYHEIMKDVLPPIRKEDIHKPEKMKCAILSTKKSSENGHGNRNKKTQTVSTAQQSMSKSQKKKKKKKKKKSGQAQAQGQSQSQTQPNTRTSAAVSSKSTLEKTSSGVESSRSETKINTRSSFRDSTEGADDSNQCVISDGGNSSVTSAPDSSLTLTTMPITTISNTISAENEVVTPPQSPKLTSNAVALPSSPGVTSVSSNGESWEQVEKKSRSRNGRSKNKNHHNNSNHGNYTHSGNHHGNNYHGGRHSVGGINSGKGSKLSNSPKSSNQRRRTGATRQTNRLAKDIIVGILDSVESEASERRKKVSSTVNRLSPRPEPKKRTIQQDDKTSKSSAAPVRRALPLNSNIKPMKKSSSTSSLHRVFVSAAAAVTGEGASKSLQKSTSMNNVASSKGGGAAAIKKSTSLCNNSVTAANAASTISNSRNISQTQVNSKKANELVAAMSEHKQPLVGLSNWTKLNQGKAPTCHSKSVQKASYPRETKIPLTNPCDSTLTSESEEFTSPATKYEISKCSSTLEDTDVEPHSDDLLDTQSESHLHDTSDEIEDCATDVSPPQSPSMPVPTLLGMESNNSATSSVASSLEAPSNAPQGTHDCRSMGEGYHLLDVCERLSADMGDFMERRAMALACRRRERGLLLGSLQETVSKIWLGRVHVEMYGSCATQLDLPSSDLDLVVCGIGAPSKPSKKKKHQNGMQMLNDHHNYPNRTDHYHTHPNASRVLRLALELEQESWAVQVKPIPTAMVPVVKILADPSRLPGAAAALGVATVPSSPDANVNPVSNQGVEDAWTGPDECQNSTMSAHSQEVQPQQQQPQQQQPQHVSTMQQQIPHYIPNQTNVQSPSNHSPNSSPVAPMMIPSLWRGADIMNGLLQVDITFEGPEHGGIGSTNFAARVVQDACNETSLPPEATPAVQLTMVLKELLAQRRLNEPFSGGLSSYALLLMVYAVIRESRALRADLAAAERQRRAVAVSTSSRQAGRDRGAETGVSAGSTAGAKAAGSSSVTSTATTVDKGGSVNGTSSAASSWASIAKNKIARQQANKVNEGVPTQANKQSQPLSYAEKASGVETNAVNNTAPGSKVEGPGVSTNNMTSSGGVQMNNGGVKQTDRSTTTSPTATMTLSSDDVGLNNNGVGLGCAGLRPSTSSFFAQGGSNDVLEVLCSGEPTAGKLLMHFLLFYGKHFDAQTMAIDVNATGSPFVPRQTGGQIDPVTGVFTVDPVVVFDPLEGAEGNNVARSCFAWANIRWVFAQCFTTLTQSLENRIRRGEENTNDMLPLLELLLSY